VIRGKFLALAAQQNRQQNEQHATGDNIPNFHLSLYRHLGPALLYSFSAPAKAFPGATRNVLVAIAPDGL